MRFRTLSAAGLGAAALIVSTMTGGVATASDTAALTAAGAAGVAAPTLSTAGTDAVDAAKGKCKTALGTGFDNGIISINNEAGGQVAESAADITCPKKKKQRTIKSVTVQGYFGDAGSTNFNVNILADDGGEPSDTDVVCSATGVGTPTGAAFPAFDETTIKLDKKCVADKGTNWVVVQADTASAWYWRVSSTVGGKYNGDFRENGAYGTGCTTFQNDRDMESCIFGGPQGSPDFMLLLK